MEGTTGLAIRRLSDSAGRLGSPIAPNDASMGVALQKAPDGVRLSLTHNQLTLIAEREHPAMAGDRTHLLDVVDIDNGIPVYAPKCRGRQCCLKRSQRLRREKPALGSQDPDQFAGCLQREHFLNVQQEVIPPDT